MVNQSITFGVPFTGADGPHPVARQGQLRIAAARLDDWGRTLVLTTDLHPCPATYFLNVPVVDADGESRPWKKLNSPASADRPVSQSAPAASEPTLDGVRATTAARSVSAHDQALPRLATEVAFPNVRFERPLAMAFPDDGGHSLFVVEQQGCIWSIPDERSTAEKSIFLDIRAKVLSPASGGHNDEGMLGLAFHPKYIPRVPTAPAKRPSLAALAAAVRVSTQSQPGQFRPDGRRKEHHRRLCLPGP